MAGPDDDPPEEHVSTRDEGLDRDLAALEAAERELADLERELDRLEGAEDPPAG
ncbi:MAG TPA: hypothetical protein VLV81_09280 [Acidimicrobiia bacterium]|nr:hypothetical protein [Acidimicrobiia bacterium]